MRISDWSSDVCSSDLPPSPAQLRTIEAELRSKIGARYSALEAVRAVLPGQRRASRKQFCSRLIAQAFAAAGIQLVARPNFCSPAKLEKSRDRKSTRLNSSH